MNLNERAEFRMDALHEPYRLLSLVNRVFVPSRITSSSGVVTSAEGLTYGRRGGRLRTIASLDQGGLTTKIEDGAILHRSQVDVKREFAQTAEHEGQQTVIQPDC